MRVEAARHAQSDDPHVGVILTLSNAIAENAGDVSAEGIAAARAAGVTDAEIGEIWRTSPGTP